MKILAIGDPHAKKNNVHEINLLTDKICELIDKVKPNYVIILGDLANDFEKMYLTAFKAIDNLLTRVSEKCETFYIVGNHDMINNQVFLTDDHFFNTFKVYRNLRIIDEVTSVLFNGMRITLCPYVPPGRFVEALNTLPDWWRESMAIFCHQEFRGAKMGAIESRVGDEWPDTYPMVYTGHIHDRDLLQCNLLNIGASRQTSFGDNDKKTVELITIEADSISSEAIDLGLPKKVSYRLTFEEFKKIELNTNDIFRLKIKDTSENIKKLKNTKKYKELRNVHKFIFVPDDPSSIKNFDKSKNFYEILMESIDKDSEYVKKLHSEIISDIFTSSKF